VTRPPAPRRETSRPPAALIVADPPVAGACLPGLQPLLGRDGCARLQAVLVRRAAAWAADVAPGRVFVAAEGVDALVPEGTVVFPQSGQHRGDRLIAAVEEVFVRAGPGPLLVAGTSVPRLSAGHAAAALTDLAEGCDATFGPALVGGFYLAGLAGPQAAVFTLPPEVWQGADLLSGVLSRAREHGLELGLLRYERELRAPLDVQALVADPLAPADVLAVLRDAA